METFRPQSRTSSKRWRFHARSGIRKTEGECELRLGQLAFASGDLTEAELWFKRSSTLCREAADQRGEANAQRWLGKVDVRTGRFDTARTRLIRSAECLSALRDVGRAARMPRGLRRTLPRRRPVRTVAAAFGSGPSCPRTTGRCPLASRTKRCRARSFPTIARPPHESPEDAWREGLSWEVEDAIRNALEGKTEFAVCRPRSASATSSRRMRPSCDAAPNRSPALPAAASARLPGSGTTRKVMNGGCRPAYFDR